VNTVNFIPAERLMRKRREARLRVWALICCGYAAALVSATALGYFNWDRDGSAIAGEMATADARIRRSTTSMNRLTVELAEARAALEAGEAIGNQPDWSRLLVILSRELGDDVVLDGCELSLFEQDSTGRIDAKGGLAPARTGASAPRKKFKLSLSGFGRTQTSVSRFVLRLEAVKLLDEVKLTRCNRQALLDGEAVAFKIDCAI